MIQVRQRGEEPLRVPSTSIWSVIQVIARFDLVAEKCELYSDGILQVRMWQRQVLSVLSVLSALGLERRDVELCQRIKRLFWQIVKCFEV